VLFVFEDNASCKYSKRINMKRHDLPLADGKIRPLDDLRIGTPSGEYSGLGEL